MSPPNIKKKHLQEVEQLINAPIINDNTSSELSQSGGERSLISNKNKLNPTTIRKSWHKARELA